ncbi:MAG: TlpA family protein disulfide reductase [Candidatus Fibromonas sp.]|jgi:thiol-disulfide isomerase/thioredoxin|nr:TlpA family protein disulfide reductase [Candidatus Fibromonas sp.]
MRTILLFLALFCVFGYALAQMLPGAKQAVPPMADSTGKPLLMDFNINLTGLKDANMPYSVFGQRPLMLYYFSPFCPHCQKSYPHIQQIAKEYEQKGLASIAVSVGGNVGKRDILMFMEQYKASIPFFQDSEQGFANKYGDGFVPRLYLISPDGKVTRYTALEPNNLKDIKADIEKLPGISK